MKRKYSFLLPALAVSVLPACKSTTREKTESSGDAVKRPNIVLFLVDDLGTDDAGCFGNPVIKTPALDALAAEGTKFTHAYCTSPSCSASRSVILTGKYNHATGQYGHSHFEHHFSAFEFIKSLPVILDSVGYRTMRVGKLHVAPPRTVFRFDDYMPKKETYPDKVWKDFSEAPYYPHSASELPPVQMAEDLRSFISANDPEPFFLYFNTWDPHHPFKREGSDTIYPKDVIVPPHMPDNEDTRRELAMYYMSMQRADKGLQRLVGILKEAGKWDNTVFIFTSDNGRPFIGAKGNLYDPGIRMPFIMRDPFIKKRGNVCDAMINFCDITPTLLDYAGIDPIPYHFHGRSFRSQLPLEKSVDFDTIYASHTFHSIQQFYPMRMIKDRKYKVIWNLAYEQTYPMAESSKSFYNMVKKYHLDYIGQRPLVNFLRRPQFEMYDMENDPNEIHNLAYDPDYSELLDFYRKKLYQFQNSTNDTWRLYQDYDLVRSLANNIKN